jgi:hypothetical protein
MLIGYVSDERYVALPDVLFEFFDGKRRIGTRSTVSGAVEAEIGPRLHVIKCRRQTRLGKEPLASVTVGKSLSNPRKAVSNRSAKAFPSGRGLAG